MVKIGIVVEVEKTVTAIENRLRAKPKAPLIALIELNQGQFRLEFKLTEFAAFTFKVAG